MLDLTALDRHRRRRHDVAGARRARRHVRHSARGRAARPTTASRSGTGRSRSTSRPSAAGWRAASAGQLSTRYGKIEDMVLGLDVVLADGRVVHTGGAPRAAVGPRPQPAVRRQRGHARGDHRRAPARAPGARRRGAGRVRLRLVRRRARRVPAHPAPRRDARGAAPLRRDRGRPALLDRRRDTMLLVLDEGDAAIVDARDAGGRTRSARRATRRRSRARRPGGSSTATTCPRSRHFISSGHVVDTMEIAARVVGAPRRLRRGARRGARRRRHARLLGAPLARVHRRRVPLLHLRRPAADRAA